jgi:ABC-type transport system substrate-binding protein
LLDGWVAPLIFEDPVAYRAAYLQKQVEGWASPDPSQTKAVIDQNKGAMTEVLTGVGNTVALIVNRNTQFKDGRLIKALNQAIDRQKLIQTFHQGLGQNSGVVTWLQEAYAIPPEELAKLPGYRSNRDQELKEARDLWTAGGGAALGDVDITVPVTWLANWSDTPQIVTKMLNDNLGVTQFKSSQSDYNKDIIPNLGNGKFPHWFGWIGQVNSTDPRNDLRNSYHTKGSTNYNKVGLLPGDPNLDAQIEDAGATVDRNEAIKKVRAIQDILMQNGQFGNVILYNYIGRSAAWNYYHGTLKVQPSPGKPASGYNIWPGHLPARSAYLDPKDPSFQGRPPASL